MITRVVYHYQQVFIGRAADGVTHVRRVAAPVDPVPANSAIIRKVDRFFFSIPEGDDPREFLNGVVSALEEKGLLALWPI